MGERRIDGAGDHSGADHQFDQKWDNTYRHLAVKSALKSSSAPEVIVASGDAFDATIPAKPSGAGAKPSSEPADRELSSVNSGLLSSVTVPSAPVLSEEPKVLGIPVSSGKLAGIAVASSSSVTPANFCHRHIEQNFANVGLIR